MLRGKMCFSLFSMPMTPATLFKIFVIWSLHVMFWSIVIPKKWKLVTCSIGLPLIYNLGVGTILGCLKNNINFDLAIFSTSLLLRSQVLTFEFF